MTSKNHNSSNAISMDAKGNPVVRVGLGVFVLQPTTGNFVIGRRKGSHGSGTWQLPGGHLEFNESFEACAAREVLEETGLVLDEKKIRFLTTTNDPMPEDGKHYVTVFMVGEAEEGAEPEVLEREKCEGWEWVGWGEMVGWVREERVDRKLFAPLVHLVNSREGVRPVLQP